MIIIIVDSKSGARKPMFFPKLNFFENFWETKYSKPHLKFQIS